MSAVDNLPALIDAIRRDLPEVPLEVWEKFLCLASRRYGTTQIYVPATPKREWLAVIAGDDDTAALAKRLGVSRRRIQQLKKLLAGG